MLQIFRAIKDIMYFAVDYLWLLQIVCPNLSPKWNSIVGVPISNEPSGNDDFEEQWTRIGEVVMGDGFAKKRTCWEA